MSYKCIGVVLSYFSDPRHPSLGTSGEEATCLLRKFGPIGNILDRWLHQKKERSYSLTPKNLIFVLFYIHTSPVILADNYRIYWETILFLVYKLITHTHTHTHTHTLLNLPNSHMLTARDSDTGERK